MGISRHAVLALVVVLQACGGNTPSPPAKSGRDQAPGGATDASGSAEQTPLGSFERSAFCRQYGCTHHDSWSLKTGATNHSYRVELTPPRLDLTPTVSIEVAAQGNDIDRYVLKFDEPNSLGDPELEVIDKLLATIDDAGGSAAVRQFFRDNVEEPVDEIRFAKSTKVGRYQLRAGTVGYDKIVDVASVAAIAAEPPPGSLPGLVPFKVAARSAAAVILLVPANTTEEDSTKLVYALREARKNRTLNRFVQPTTPENSEDPFAIVMVFVMADPAWATTPRLNAFIKPTSSSVSPEERDFGRRVLAYYYYAALTKREDGTIGYADDEIRYTTVHKKLF